MLTIVNCGTSNIGSVINMLKKIGADCQIATKPNELSQAQKIILPGVGSYDRCISQLRESQMDKTLIDLVTEKNIPLLGVCVGMQMLLEGSEEGSEPGLALIPGKIRKFKHESNQGFKVPHMGWKYIEPNRDHILFNNFQEKVKFYFVHSYHAEADNKYSIAACQHGYKFSCAVSSGNIHGVQFHPEKSHKYGMQLLRNFVEKA